MNAYDGWLTNDNKFLMEEFSHKETLRKHGYGELESDTAIKRGFVRLCDNGDVLNAEVWHTHYAKAREWLERNVKNRIVEIEVFSHAPIPKMARFNSK